MDRQQAYEYWSTIFDERMELLNDIHEIENVIADDNHPEWERYVVRHLRALELLEELDDMLERLQKIVYG